MSVAAAQEQHGAHASVINQRGKLEYINQRNLKTQSDKYSAEHDRDVGGSVELCSWSNFTLLYFTKLQL